MKILHTGDLHLNSQLSTIYPTDKIQIRRSELLSTFERMIDYAITNGVEVFLIAGDLFDGNNPTSGNEQLVMDMIERASNIQFFYVKGNHESDYSPSIVCPSNLHLFPKMSVQTYDLGEVTISGSQNNSCYNDLKLDQDKFNIVMLHGELNSNISDINGIHLNLFNNMNVNYFALGHIHKHDGFHSLGNSCTYSYCGIPEPRGFDETGEKGFVLIETTKTNAKYSFVPFSKRKVYSIPLSISTLFRVPDIKKQIGELVKDIPQQDIVRIELVGCHEPDFYFSNEFLKTDFLNRFFLFDIKNSTNLSETIKNLENDHSLRSEFMKLVVQHGYKKEDEQFILQNGLRALNGEEIESCE